MGLHSSPQECSIRACTLCPSTCWAPPLLPGAPPALAPVLAAGLNSDSPFSTAGMDGPLLNPPQLLQVGLTSVILSWCELGGWWLWRLYSAWNCSMIVSFYHFLSDSVSFYQLTLKKRPRRDCRQVCSLLPNSGKLCKTFTVYIRVLSSLYLTGN